MIQIGPYTLHSPVVLAPMAGITDQPFRTLCREHGAGLTPSEMLTSNTALWDSEKNRLRRRHQGEMEPRIVQIAGSDPDMMATAARLNVDHGAQIIDINMGCPAKKVLKKAAGSALLKDELLVEEILSAVVCAVDIPVTLKIRTGWNPGQRNGVRIARIAEACGVRALAVHGRTRECMFRGEAEYDTIGSIKEAVSIPVFANGDICSPQKAKYVLDYTGADGVMIGRAAQGRPWIFREIQHYLCHGKPADEMPFHRCCRIIIRHLNELYRFYGDNKGVFIARKHITWYLQLFAQAGQFRKLFNTLETPQHQLEAIRVFLDETAREKDLAA